MTETSIEVYFQRVKKAAQNSLDEYLEQKKRVVDETLDAAWKSRKDGWFVRLKDISEAEFKTQFYADADDLTGGKIWFYKHDWWRIEENLKTLINMADVAGRGKNKFVRLSEKHFHLISNHL